MDIAPIYGPIGAVAGLLAIVGTPLAVARWYRGRARVDVAVEQFAPTRPDNDGCTEYEAVVRITNRSPTPDTLADMILNMPGDERTYRIQSHGKELPAELLPCRVPVLVRGKFIGYRIEPRGSAQPATITVCFSRALPVKVAVTADCEPMPADDSSPVNLQDAIEDAGRGG